MQTMLFSNKPDREIVFWPVSRFLIQFYFLAQNFSQNKKHAMFVMCHYFLFKKFRAKSEISQRTVYLFY